MRLLSRSASCSSRVEVHEYTATIGETRVARTAAAAAEAEAEQQKQKQKQQPPQTQQPLQS